MNKLFSSIAILCMAVIFVNAQATPTKLKTYLDKNYPNWKIGESWVVDSKPRKALETGDFNGDGVKDYAVLLTKADRIYAIVLLTEKNSYKAYNILAQNSENRWIAGIGMNKKGDVIELDPINSDKTIKLKTDAIYLYDGEGHGTTFYWENGKFVDSAETAFSESDGKQYIGYEYQGAEMPDGLKNVGGYILAKNDQDILNSPFAINFIQRDVEELYGYSWLWFIKGDKESKVDRVVDVLKLPTTKKNETVVAGQCFFNGKQDGEIIAIAVYVEDAEFFTKIIKAWRANTTTEKFEEISIKGIKCANEGFGV